MPKMLVAERGLRSTRRNRRWLALLAMLERELGGDQADNERLAWKILQTYETTP